MSKSGSPHRARRFALAAVLLLIVACMPPYGQLPDGKRMHQPMPAAQEQCLEAALAPENQEGRSALENDSRSRVVNIGFEDVTSDDPARIPEIARQLNSVNATGVSISVGRLDWLGFPWEGAMDIASEEVARTGRDFVREAINAFICSDRGQRRTISLNIDTLLGRELEWHPEKAGINAKGEASKNWGSISAWKHSDLTGRLELLIAELVNRYGPDSINITEMMFPTHTFGEDDLRDFQRFSGRAYWPQDDEGKIDSGSEPIHAWRSDAVTTIMSKAAKRVEGTGVRLTMDVRSPANDDPRGRLDSGQDYEALLEVVDRLNIWNFQGIKSSSYHSTDELADLFVQQNPTRIGIEIGLWENDGALDTKVLEHELSLAEEQDVSHLSVTPTSLMDQDAWETLRRIWGSPQPGGLED